MVVGLGWVGVGCVLGLVVVCCGLLGICLTLCFVLRYYEVFVCGFVVCAVGLGSVCFVCGLVVD